MTDHLPEPAMIRALELDTLEKIRERYPGADVAETERGIVVRPMRRVERINITMSGPDEENT